MLRMIRTQIPNIEGEKCILRSENHLILDNGIQGKARGELLINLSFIM